MLGFLLFDIGFEELDSAKFVILSEELSLC